MSGKGVLDLVGLDDELFTKERASDPGAADRRQILEAALRRGSQSPANIISAVSSTSEIKLTFKFSEFVTFRVGIPNRETLGETHVQKHLHVFLQPLS